MAALVGRVFLRTVHNEALKLALYLDTTHSANRSLRVIPRRCPVKLTNLTITPKLGILVGVTLFGLCVAGALAGYLMQREMLEARIIRPTPSSKWPATWRPDCRNR